MLTGVDLHVIQGHPTPPQKKNTETFYRPSIRIYIVIWMY